LWLKVEIKFAIEAGKRPTRGKEKGNG